MPIQRMANVSPQPAPGGPSTADLIAGVEHGIDVVGDKSWSIDMQRYNFQFTGQRFFKVSGGRLAGQLRDVAYQATTTDFWNSMEVVGGPRSYVLGRAFNRGKGQPSQIAPVSHGCPAVLVRGIRILNAAQEGNTLTANGVSGLAQAHRDRDHPRGTGGPGGVPAKPTRVSPAREAGDTWRRGESDERDPGGGVAD